MLPFAHRRMRRAVEAYVDDELTPDAIEAVAQHLSNCWECSVVAETLRLIKHALRQRYQRAPTVLAERRLRRYAENLMTTPHSGGAGIG